MFICEFLWNFDLKLFKLNAWIFEISNCERSNSWTFEKLQFWKNVPNDDEDPRNNLLDLDYEFHICQQTLNGHLVTFVFSSPNIRVGKIQEPKFDALFRNIRTALSISFSILWNSMMMQCAHTVCSFQLVARESEMSNRKTQCEVRALWTTSKVLRVSYGTCVFRATVH